MKVYLFQAALLCAVCGEKTKAETPKPAGMDENNESTWDSDKYPKGPYCNGGGEADTPQHCDVCNVFLKNPLTKDGEAYVKAEAKHTMNPVVREWIEYYSYLF
jgi:hypothetical protein